MEVPIWLAADLTADLTADLIADLTADRLYFNGGFFERAVPCTKRGYLFTECRFFSSRAQNCGFLFTEFRRAVGAPR